MPAVPKLTKARVERDFTNHPPDAETQETMEALRVKIKAVATTLHSLPSSREAALAITNLEQSTMWAMAALARGNYDATLNGD